ncbi:hypothetical protein VUN82_03360 [Micrococcaceae bacterium Sec5.1]
MPPVRLLTAGPWSARLTGDELGHIAYADRPVLRAVKAVVRDQDWRTPQPRLSNIEVTHNDDGLRVRWEVRYAGYGIDYGGFLAASFTPEALDISFEGTAIHTFRSNRIGLVVLHPPTDAGREIRVEHPDGTKERAHFPVAISPHQPFRDIAALEWVDAGTAFRLSFTGDIFETEDQRNWTDASFKTYSTPLARPFPVVVARGDTVRQAVRMAAAPFEPKETPNSVSVAPLPRNDETIVIDARLGLTAGHVPALALGAGSPSQTVPPLPGLEAVLVELSEGADSNSRSGWANQLTDAAKQAAIHGAALDIRAVTRDPAGVVADLEPYLSRTLRLGVFDPVSHVTDHSSWPKFRSAVRAAGFNGSLLAGARSQFTELNRNSSRLPLDADAVTFSVTPQTHTSEVAHIIESVPMQELVLENALRLGGGKTVHVGPVTLLPRFNAVATSGVASDMEFDELQAEPFAAAWVLASVAALTRKEVGSVTFFETSGPRGIADRTGRLNPAGEVLKELAALRSSPTLSVDLSTDLPVTIYPVQSSAGLVVFGANLSQSRVDLNIHGPDDDVGEGPRRLTLQPWSADILHYCPQPVD